MVTVWPRDSGGFVTTENADFRIGTDFGGISLRTALVAVGAALAEFLDQEGGIYGQMRITVIRKMIFYGYYTR